MILLATKKSIVVTTTITNVTTVSRFRPDAEDNQALFACEAHHPALQVENQHEQLSENDCFSGRCELPFSSQFSSRLRNQRSLATSRGRPSGSSSLILMVMMMVMMVMVMMTTIMTKPQDGSHSEDGLPSSQWQSPCPGLVQPFSITTAQHIHIIHTILITINIIRMLSRWCGSRTTRE